jgi:hypothetical protein
MSREYDLYLQEHKENVFKGLEWIHENIPGIILDGYYPALEQQIKYGHDASKSDPDEYDAYDKYFYGKNRSYQVVQDFNYAWLMHQKKNPHHWQYWTLVQDNPKEGIIALDMPYEYVIEMVCDWWAFSWAKENLREIFGWYDEHKDYMKLSDKTRKTVESILKAISDKLDELEAAEKVEE